MKAIVTAMALGALVTALPSGAAAQSKCDAGKLKEYGKKVSCLAKVEAKAAKAGTAIDSGKEQKCIDKFVEKCAKAEAKGDCTGAVKTCAELASEGETCRDTADLAPATTPSKCDAGRWKEYGKKVSCLAKVEAKAAKAGTAIDSGKEQKCIDKFVKKCAKAETKGDCTGSVMTCAELATEAETCRDAAAPCLVDLGLTVRDTCTGLEWEKKDGADPTTPDYGNPHDVDNQYPWMGVCIDGQGVPTYAACQPNAAAAATCAALTGGASECSECLSGETCDPDFNVPIGATTTVWGWLAELNAANFAGHGDWRLPTIGAWGDPAEFESITDCSVSASCIDPIFGPNAPIYWTGVSSPYYSSEWVVWTFSPPAGSETIFAKDYFPWWVRAVR